MMLTPESESGRHVSTWQPSTVICLAIFAVRLFESGRSMDAIITHADTERQTENLMAPNDRQPASPQAGVPAPKPPQGRVDPRLWALLPIAALLILGAYFLGKYLNRPEPAPTPVVAQAPAPTGPPGKMTVTEVPHPISVVPITPAAPVQPPAPAVQPGAAEPSKQEEPAVVLPSPAEQPAGGDGSTNASSPDGSPDPGPDAGTPAVTEPDRDPVKMNDPAQEYPSSAYEEGVEGASRVSFVINAEGAVEDAQISQSSGDSRLDQAAVDYVNRLRFRPAIRNGQPTAVRVSRNVRFSRQ
jgi:periplasmic protein TonB